MNLLAPILLGLAASLHCVGMCGSFLLALPLDAAGKRAVLRQMGIYHAGRILTYAALLKAQFLWSRLAWGPCRCCWL